MVFGFLCHSLSGSPCRVLYSTIFGDDLQPHSTQVTTLDSLRVSRKEQLLQVACRVQAEYGFTQATRDPANEHSGSADEMFADRGLFRLAAGDSFATAKTVLWLARDECAYVLICELDENTMQAEAVLSAITKLVVENITSHEQKNAELMLKSEKIAVILNQFLPCGQIQFLNHKLQAQLERQVEKIMAAK